MAWTTPRTWNVGELVTKLIMDTHIRDNLNYLKEQVDASFNITDRKGGSATVWNTPGSTNYSVTTTPTCQVGSFTATPALGGGFYGFSGIITYPVAFTNAPLVLITVGGFNPADASVVCTTFNITNTQAQLGFKSASNPGAVTIHWMAIGE